MNRHEEESKKRLYVSMVGRCGASDEAAAVTSLGDARNGPRCRVAFGFPAPYAVLVRAPHPCRLLIGAVEGSVDVNGENDDATR